MSASEFAAKWLDSSLKESAGSQSHFNDLCRATDERLLPVICCSPSGRSFLERETGVEPATLCLGSMISGGRSPTITFLLGPYSGVCEANSLEC